MLGKVVSKWRFLEIFFYSTIGLNEGKKTKLFFLFILLDGILPSYPSEQELINGQHNQNKSYFQHFEDILIVQHLHFHHNEDERHLMVFLFCIFHTPV